MLFRYSRWDGTQHLADLDADDLLAAMSDDLMSDGDLWNALRRMFQRGVQDANGHRMPGIQDRLEGLDAGGLQAMREMMRDLNRMLRERAEGDEPDFGAFKAKWGQNFPGVESLDELLEQLGRQAAQMQSLLDSMSPGQRRQLQEMMSSLFMKDERLEAEMAQLAMNLDQLGLTEELRRRYDFRGDDELTMREAMKLMDELQQMEELERQLRRVQSPDDLERIDPVDVEKLLGEEAALDLERLKELAKKLEEAGYLERKGDRLELTARPLPN